MKLLIIMLVVSLLLVACTTTNVITVTPTPQPNSPSILEQSWIEGWTKDGSGVREARCIWGVIMGHFGGEDAYAVALVTTDDGKDLANAIFLTNPVGMVECFE